MDSDDPIDAPRPWRAPLLMALYILGAWVACVALGLAFSWLGEAHGCHINEGGTSPCVVGGVEIGGFAIAPLLLAAFGAPLFVIGIIISLAIAGILFVTRRRD
jgi:hypothetical protein